MLHLDVNVEIHVLPEYRVISAMYFPVFGLNTEIFGVNLSIHSEYMRIRTRNNSVLGCISRSGDEKRWF